MATVLVQEWTDGLSGVSDDRLKYGLDALLESGATFCPSLPALIAACKKPPPKFVGYEFPALTHRTDAKQYSLYVAKVRGEISKKDRLSHADDNLDEKKRRFAETIENMIKAS